MKTGSWLAVAPPELRHVKSHPKRWGMVFGLVFAVLGACAFLVLVGATIFGCAAAVPACKVIDLAHDVCTVITYKDEQGRTQSVQVPAAELRALGMAAQARQAASGAAPAPSAPR